MSTPGGTGVIAGRRKLFVQDGYISGCVPTIGHGFRRTLVGLKSLSGPTILEVVGVSDAPLWG